MYWAENGGMGLVPAITRANMDGSGMGTIITGNLGHTDFITIDIEQQKLYWTEGTDQQVSGHNFCCGCNCSRGGFNLVFFLCMECKSLRTV